MITERLMANGEFSLKFTPDAGLWAFGRVLPFGTLVITPARLNPVTTSWATLVANAVYVGVVDTIDKKSRTIAGQGVAALLGDNERGPQIMTAITKTAASLSTWLTDVIPGGAATNGITLGTNGTPSGTVTDSLQYVTRRAALEKLCTAFGAEWKVTPNPSTGAIEVSAALPSSLFTDYTTPKTLVVKGGQSRDAGTRSGRVIDLSNRVDVEEYVTAVTAIGRGDGGAEVQTATGSGVYYGPFGHALDMGIVVDAPEVKRGQTAAFASSVLASRSGVKNTLTLSTDTYNLPADVRPGDRIAVYDPDQDLYDTANTMIYEGRQVSPIYVRVVGWTWPKRAGMGVYYRTPATGGDVVIDLSEVIADENGAASAEIGAWSRGIDWTANTAPGSPQVTGDLPKASTVDAWPTWGPVFTQTGTLATTTTSATMHREGRTISGQAFGAGGTGGTAGQAIKLLLPVTARYATNLPVGWWRWYRSAAGISYGGFLSLSVDGLHAQLNGWTHGPLGNDPNFAPAAGDEWYLNFSYEAAVS